MAGVACSRSMTSRRSVSGSSGMCSCAAITSLSTVLPTSASSDSRRWCVQAALAATFSPEVLFASASTLEDTVFLDRVCRTLHVRNFVRQANDSGWLFLNINPMVTMHGREFGAFFSQLLARYGIPPHRIVIEILEEPITDEVRLAESVCYYRDMGCLIAIDDFGIGHSNFDRITPYCTAYRQTGSQHYRTGCHNKTVQRVLPGLSA